MKASAWLVVHDNGIRRMTKNRPPLEADELAVQVTVNIPDALFHRPIIEAVVKVDSIETFPVVSSETVVHIEEQLRAAFGMDVSVVVREPADQT